MNREGVYKKFKFIMRYKVSLIVNFVRLLLGEREGRMCLEDGNFYRNVLILEEKEI